MFFERLEMYAHQLRTDPVGFIIYMCYYVFAILFSLILHECAHGYMALRCGDPTAKMLGRLSLNPARHLDPMGTLFMFLLGFGWAKPVPVNPRNFQNYRRDDFLVSIAGIVTNLTLFLICTVISIILNQLIWTPQFHDIIMEEFGSLEMMINPSYGWVLVFDDAKSVSASMVISSGHELATIFPEFIQHGWLLWVQRLVLLMAQVNLTLGLFNLLPIPPLDGFHLLNDTLLKGRLRLSQQMFQITHFALLILCFTGILGKLLTSVIDLVGGSVIRTFLMLFGLM